MAISWLAVGRWLPMRSKTKRPKLARRKTKLGLPDLITPSQPSPSLPSSNLPYKNSAPNHFADSNSFVMACHTRWRGTFKRIFFSIVSEIGVDTMQSIALTDSDVARCRRLTLECTDRGTTAKFSERR